LPGLQQQAIVLPAKGTTYRALSAESSTAFGLSPSFVVHDELGLNIGPRSELFEALESATGALILPLSIIISTQSASDNDLFSLLIDDAVTGTGPPRFACCSRHRLISIRSTLQQ
jgi:hypothetical protein